MKHKLLLYQKQVLKRKLKAPLVNLKKLKQKVTTRMKITKLRAYTANQQVARLKN